MKGMVMTVIIFTTSMKKKEQNQHPEERFAATAFELLVAKKIHEQLENLELIPKVKVVTATTDEQTVFVGDFDEAVKTAIKEIIQDVWTEGDFWHLADLLQFKETVESEEEHTNRSRLVRKLIRFALSTNNQQIINTSQEAFRANEEYVHAMNKIEETVDKKISGILGQE
jgi:hypothetical protein